MHCMPPTSQLLFFLFLCIISFNDQFHQASNRHQQSASNTSIPTNEHKRQPIPPPSHNQPPIPTANMVSYRLILSTIAALATTAVCMPPLLAPNPPVPLSPGSAEKDGHVAPPSVDEAEIWMGQHDMNSMATYCDSDYRSKRMQTRFEVWGYVDKLNLDLLEGLDAAIFKCHHPHEWYAKVEPTSSEYDTFYAKWYQDPSGDKCTSQAIADFVGSWPGVKCT
ncbi:hypothetical protein LTR95_015163 [Oleoguttula sp. CCFEE 5521]